MNIYDFDGTIYRGDSSIDFFLFCARKYPQILVSVPRQAKGFLLYGIHRIDKTKLKESFFSFLLRVPDVENAIREFWDQNENKIETWYLKNQKEDDIVISASPCFLIEHICERIDIHCVVASDVDKKNGTFRSKNCWGMEKINKLYEKYPGIKIDSFYSDSLSDRYMARCAERAFLVKNGRIYDWPMEEKQC